MKAVIFVTIVAMANAKPKPEPCYGCDTRLYSPPVYTASSVVSRPVYTAPSVVTSHVAPAVTHEYTTHSVGPATYHLGATEVHTTSHHRYDVRVPVTYTYHVEQPIKHTTTVFNRQPFIYEKVYSAPVSVPSTSWSSSYIPPSASSVHSYHTGVPVSTWGADPWC